MDGVVGNVRLHRGLRPGLRGSAELFAAARLVPHGGAFRLGPGCGSHGIGLGGKPIPGSRRTVRKTSLHLPGLFGGWAGMVSATSPVPPIPSAGSDRAVRVIKITNSRQKNFHSGSGFRFAGSSRTVGAAVFQPGSAERTRSRNASLEIRLQAATSGCGGVVFLHIPGEVTMSKRMKLGIFFMAALAVVFELSVGAPAQQTLGGITGTVTDSSGSVLPDTSVTIVGDQTKLTRALKTNGNGAYDFVNLPIGTYTVTVGHEGFQSERLSSILVQADRTATLNVTLKVGQVGTTIDVEAAPIMNAVDTTNGYVLEEQQIRAVPLPTGSFTGLAILSPGVNAELAGGTGVNSGLGNQPIWANGQRDTSNTFLVNGVDASNLFNGKSTSQVASARIVNNTGVANAASTSAAPIQSTASVYLAVGQSLPTPAPETVQELRVNTSMYDAQQGSTSGAHIDMSTAAGTNVMHGEGYVHRGTDWLNAAPFFNKQDPNIPSDDKVPQMHRYTVGGKVGGALIKDKLFGFVSYQHTHDSDQEIGLSRLLVPHGLTSDRSPAALAAISDNIWGTTLSSNLSAINPVALALFQYKLPNGQYMIPNDDGQIPTPSFPENAISPGTAYFLTDQAVADLDWVKSSKDTVSAKYYYQHDPSIAPYAYSSVAGFNQRLDAGSQVASLTNAQALTPHLSLTEVIGILREKLYSTIDQPFTPQQLGINTFGSTFFPGITIADPLGLASP